mgnify:CR=1 FL=1
MVADHQKRSSFRKVLFALHLDLRQQTKGKGNATFEDGADEHTTRIFYLFGHTLNYTQTQKKTASGCRRFGELIEFDRVFVGDLFDAKQEEHADEQGIDYVTGKARYRDMPRGKIMGIQDGFLKLVFRRDDLLILGVHIIGPIASEIIHYGMMLVHNNTKIPQILSAVFNYPTLHDLYKYACYDGLGNKSGHKIKK